MTIELCKDFCRRKGYIYAGMDSAESCLCGYNASTQKLDDSKCSKICSGNMDQICGGDSALNVFIASDDGKYAFVRFIYRRHWLLSLGV